MLQQVLLLLRAASTIAGTQGRAHASLQECTLCFEASLLSKLALISQCWCAGMGMVGSP